MTLGKAIKKQLESNNMSQTDLAKKLNITRQQVWNSIERWDSGHTPTIKTIKKWSKALHVDYRNFIDYL